MEDQRRLIGVRGKQLVGDIENHRDSDDANEDDGNL